MIQLQELDTVWEYDGSFLGFMCVVDQAFSRSVIPTAIVTPEEEVTSLFPTNLIVTNEERGTRIYQRLTQRLTNENRQFIQDGFNATLVDKEKALLQAIAIALSTGDSLGNFIGQPQILALQKAIRTLLGEAHLYTGFVRFEYVGNVLFSKIAPKHRSLPYICPHFAQRYPQEQILIYDETHRLLAMIQQGRTSLLEAVSCPEVPTGNQEDVVAAQWRTFLEAVTIQERINPALQRNLLPLRFREKMVEFQ